MKIYVATSWRNDYQPDVVRGLREMGHEVYDFRNPKEGNTGFHWEEIDVKWQAWSVSQYRESLDHPIAEAGFQLDMDALLWCDAVVAVQPFGRSASLELGWAAGAGKFTVLLLSVGEPELMVKMCDRICLGLGEVLLALQDFENAQATTPTPTPTPTPASPPPADDRVAEAIRTVLTKLNSWPSCIGAVGGTLYEVSRDVVAPLMAALDAEKGVG